MKPIRSTIALMSFAILAAGCSNLDIEDIFNGKNSDAIAPVELSDGYGYDMSGYFGYGAWRRLSFLQPLLEDNGAEHDSGTFSMMINDSEQLEGMTYSDGTPVEWPDIDFDKYTLVVGQYWVPASNYRISDQRIIVGKDKITLYLEIRDYVEYATLATTMFYFASVYPKLPNLPMEVHRWSNRHGNN